MKSFSPFDHRPHPDLGDLLREVLDVKPDATFTDRVMEEARLVDRSVFRIPWWEVLGQWARPGVAAALVLVLASLASFSLGLGNRDFDVTIDDALSETNDATEPSQLIASPTPPDVDVVLAAVFER